MFLRIRTSFNLPAVTFSLPAVLFNHPDLAKRIFFVERERERERERVLRHILSRA
jgi:hypothetical protein